MNLSSKKIQDQILDMMSRDRKEHKVASKNGNWSKWKEIAKANTRNLKKLVAKHGWPTISKVGKRASRAAWFVTQHSDADFDFQRDMLMAIKKAAGVNPKDVLKENLAFLEDRVLVNSGKKQLYGSQFYVNKKGELVPRPISNRKNLDERRREYNLPPFSEYVESAKEYSKKSKKKQ